MRGDDDRSSHLFSYLSPEQRVPADHPLRAIRTMTDDALRRMSSRFEALYASTGRPSVPPEQLLRARLPQVLYSVRSERLLMEQLQYNLLFRWFVGLGMDDAQSGRRPLSRRIESGSSTATSRGPSSKKSSSRPVDNGCCRTSISLSTARCWRRGPARKASAGKTRRAGRRRMTRVTLR